MIEVGFKSDKGLRRRNNEDAFFVIPEDRIFMVADGVGGNNSGEVASRTAISRIVEHIRNNALAEGLADADINGYFMRCFTEVNRTVYEMSRLWPENAGMATTLTVAYFSGNKAYVVNVGDSRAYLYRSGALTQITEDHTYVNALIKKGLISQEEALHHEKRNVITRAIGGEETIAPDIFRFEVMTGDIMLLCTDGLHGETGDDNIRKLIGAGGSMAEICTALVNKANRCGGRDNITVVCLKILEGQS